MRIIEDTKTLIFVKFFNEFLYIKSIFISRRLTPTELENFLRQKRKKKNGKQLKSMNSGFSIRRKKLTLRSSISSIPTDT